MAFGLLAQLVLERQPRSVPRRMLGFATEVNSSRPTGKMPCEGVYPHQNGDKAVNFARKQAV